MAVQVSDNSVQVFDVGKTIDQATNDANSKYTFDRVDGRSMNLTRNGKALAYNTPAGSIRLDAYKG
jgi:hypothetical protein